MSGGTFDGLDSRLRSFSYDIEEYLSEKALAEYEWTQDMQDIMRAAQLQAQILAIVIHRIDYVIAGDASLDDIRKRVIADLKRENLWGGVNLSAWDCLRSLLV